MWILLKGAAESSMKSLFLSHKTQVNHPYFPWMNGVSSSGKYFRVTKGFELIVMKVSSLITILRGMRALSDFEYEFQMALMNRRQTKNIETVFLMSGYRWFYTSSKLIKEVASLGGSVRGLVPENVHNKLMEKFNIKNNRK
jgi:pantetheine-phosphate adenylyltransferase